MRVAVLAALAVLSLVAGTDAVARPNPIKPAPTRAKVTSRPAPKKVTTVTVSKSKHPESAKHIKDAQKAGHPTTLTVARDKAKQNREESLRGIKTKPGKDRDEYPPAMFKEGGKGASVRHIDASDNRGAGSCIGQQCRKLKNGDQVKMKVGK